MLYTSSGDDRGNKLNFSNMAWSKNNLTTLLARKAQKILKLQKNTLQCITFGDKYIFGSTHKFNASQPTKQTQQFIDRLLDC